MHSERGDDAGMRTLLISVMALLAIDVAVAQEISPRDMLTSDCYDDNLTDRCNAQGQRARRERHNLRSIEALAAANVQTRRVFYVDGYGREMPVVIFQRERGRSAEVVVSATTRDADDQPRIVEMRAPITNAVWRDVVQRTQRFAEVPSPRPADSEHVICLHSWVMTMEAADPGQRTPVRARTQDSCNRGGIREPAFDLARIAYDALPHCRALNRQHYRNEVSAFPTCALLEGDQLASAQAVNRFNDFQRLDEGGVGASGFISTDAEMDWMGERVRGSGDVASLWSREQLTRKFYFRRAVGESEDRVRVFGVVVEALDANARSAEAELVWTRTSGSDFTLASAIVGPFASASAD